MRIINGLYYISAVRTLAVPSFILMTLVGEPFDLTRNEGERERIYV